MSKPTETEQSKESSEILVLDDEHSIRWVLERTLSQAGYIPQSGHRRTRSEATSRETFDSARFG